MNTPPKPPEYFKVGDVVIHQGNDNGEYKGEEFTILESLDIYVRLNTGQDVWGYRLLPESNEFPNGLGAKPEWLKKKQDKGELGFTDLMESLNKPVEVE